MDSLEKAVLAFGARLGPPIAPTGRIYGMGKCPDCGGQAAFTKAVVAGRPVIFLFCPKCDTTREVPNA